MAIEETRNKDLLRGLFARDPIGAIYLIGDLEEKEFACSRWFVDGEAGVLLLYGGLSVPVMLPFGDSSALLREVALPARFYTKLTEDERARMAGWDLSEPDELYVMGLDELVQPPPVPGLKMRRVHDGGEIESLYADYPGNYFVSSRVRAGFYVAAEFEGQVVAAAGTHAWAEHEGAAALGNVVTAIPHRGRGIGRALVAYLCEELAARGCRHFGLHVNRLNRAAITCYRGIGFRIHSEITQWTAERG